MFGLNERNTQVEVDEFRGRLSEDDESAFVSSGTYKWKFWKRVRSNEGYATFENVLLRVYPNETLELYYDAYIHFPKVITRTDFTFWDSQNAQIGGEYSLAREPRGFEFSRVYPSLMDSWRWTSPQFNFNRLNDAYIRLHAHNWH